MLLQKARFAAPARWASSNAVPRPLTASKRAMASQQQVCHATQVLQQAFTIVGGGRVGQALAEMGPGTDVVLGRGQGMDGALESGPIVVCTRNDDLAAVVHSTPPPRRKDLVFIQNGMLQPWLDAQGLGDNTQVLVFFAVAKKGDKPVDGKTDVNPEGLTAAYGPHAEAVAARLLSGGLSCKVLDRESFKAAMLEKLVWISAYMLLGAKFKQSVGDVETLRKPELQRLITELVAGGAAELGVRVQDGYVDRLNAYARSVAHFPTAVKEFSWRNGWFWSISQRELEAGRPDPFPYHTELLKDVKV